MTDVLLLNSTYEPLGVVDVARRVRLLFYVARRRKKVALTKKNVLLRDGYACGYCGVAGAASMTVDHVVPRIRGEPRFIPWIAS